jgi:hypothetical protein
MGGFLVRSSDSLFPEHLPALAREAAQIPAIADCLGQKYAVAPDNRGGVSWFGEWDAPLDVFGRAPFERQICFGGNAGPERAAPGGPIGGEHC